MNTNNLAFGGRNLGRTGTPRKGVSAGSGLGGLNKDEYTATALQTVFTLSGTITKGFQVFQDGAILSYGYTKTASNEITFTAGLPLGTEIIIIY